MFQFSSLLFPPLSTSSPLSQTQDIQNSSPSSIDRPTNQSTTPLRLGCLRTYQQYAVTHFSCDLRFPYPVSHLLTHPPTRVNIYAFLPFSPPFLPPSPFSIPIRLHQHSTSEPHIPTLISSHSATSSLRSSHTLTAKTISRSRPLSSFHPFIFSKNRLQRNPPPPPQLSSSQIQALKASRAKHYSTCVCIYVCATSSNLQSRTSNPKSITFNLRRSIRRPSMRTRTRARKGRRMINERINHAKYHDARMRYCSADWIDAVA